MSDRAEASGPAFWGDVDDTEARERYQTLVNAIDDGIYQLDSEARFVAVNDVIVEMTGYDRENLLGEHVSVLFDDEAVSTLEREIERLDTNPTDRSELLEFPVETAEGTQIRCEVRVNRLEADDASQGTVGTVREIAGRKRTDEKPGKRERELEVRSAAMEETVDGIAILDENEEYVFANQAHAEIYGYDDPAAFLGESWRLCYDDEELERLEAAAMPTLSEDGSWRGEATGLQKDGSLFPQELSLTVLDDGRYICVVRDITERRERERNLHKTREQLEVATSAGSVGIWTWNVQENVLTADKYLAESYGMDPEEAATGAPIEAFFEPVYEEDRERVWQKLDEAVEETGEFEAEYRVRDANDDTMWVVSRAEVEYGDDGTPLRMNGAISDITERKEAEEALRESGERVRSALEIDTVGVIFWGDDFTITEANDAFVRMSGYTHEEVVGKGWQELTPDEFYAVSEQAVTDVKATGRTEPYEKQYIRKDGSRWWGLFAPRRLSNGEFVEFILDITERKQAEKALQESEERLRLATDTAEMGVLELDLQSEESPVRSPHHNRIFGYEEPPDDWSVDIFLDHVHPDDREWVKHSFEEAFETGEWEFECRIGRADGEQRWIASQGEFYYDEGEPVRAVGIVQDITDRKDQQQYLRDAKTRLEAATEAGAVGTWEWHIPEDRIVAGPSFAREFGLDPDAAAEGVPLEQFTSSIHEDDRERVEREIEEAVESCGEYEAEYRVWNADDELSWVVARGHVECDEGGNPVTFPGALTDITERKKIERKLRESEAKLRMLAENLEEIVWMATPDAEEFIYINPAFEDVWGRDRDELYDEPLTFLESVHPDDRERVREEFAALPEIEFDDEFRIVRPDGEVRWVHARGTRVDDEDEELVRVVGVGEDVTERKESERKLEQSERRYRTLAENFPNGAVAVYDHDLRYTLTQGAVLGDSLPSRDQLEGRTVPEVFPSHIITDLEPQLRAAVEDGETSSATFEFGGRHWEVWATPLRDDHGDIFAGLSFTQDVTEQVGREAELERALDLLEKSERIADVGGWEINPKTQDVFWTDQIFELLEVTGDEEPPLEEALDMYHEEDKPIVEEAVENALATGDPFDVEVRIRTNSGEMRWLRLQGVPETVDDEVVSFRGAVQDITEQVEREQRLEGLIDNLETSNDRLEQFAYAASHDLQEPLRMVSSYLQLIEQRYGDALDEDGEEFIDFAVDGAERMRAMINALLEYSRVESRGDPLEPVDLDTVLSGVREDLQMQVVESDAEISVEPLPRVEGDPSQLRQVFQNLLDNAIEYSVDEPPRIHVAAERTGSMWEVSVRDEGIGIDPDQADRIFEVFQRLHSREEHAGTGIGLALCRRIIERHGGDIWVDSEPGEGTTFSFTLPAVGESDA